MNISKIVDEARRVKGAVTLDDAMERLDNGTKIYILLHVQNLVVITGTVVFVQYMETETGSQDILVTVQFTSDNKSTVQSMMLGGLLNGKSALAGDESGGSFSRLFTSMDDSIRYFEQVQFCKELKELERTSSVSKFISRLLDQRKNPKKGE